MNKHFLAIAVALISVNASATGDDDNHDNDGNHDKPYVVEGSIAGSHYIEQWQNETGYRESGAGILSYKAKNYDGAFGRVDLTVTPTNAYLSNTGDIHEGNIDIKASIATKLTGNVSHGKIFGGTSSAGFDVGIKYQAGNQSIYTLGSIGTETTGIGVRSHEPVALTNESVANGLTSATYRLNESEMAVNANINLNAGNSCAHCQTLSAGALDFGVASSLEKGQSFISGIATGTGYNLNEHGQVSINGTANVVGSITDAGLQVSSQSSVAGTH